MKRLTKRWGKEPYPNLAGKVVCEYKECDSTKSCNDCVYGRIAQRLAAIEDILGDEYELEQIQGVFDEWHHYLEFASERNAIEGAVVDIYDDGKVDWDRLRKLVEADRLKSKEVWTQAKYLRTFPINPDSIERATILYISLLKGGEILCHTQSRAFSIDEIGKTAFLTNEEAEAALKAREQDD